MDFVTARTAMVDCQVRPSDVTRFDIIDAMLSVPREEFVPTSLRAVAYSGEHVQLPAGRVLLDPRVTGKFLDAVAPSPEDLVLDLGSGFGYSAALLARLSQAVVAVEEDEAMAKAAEETLRDQGVDNVIVAQGALTNGAAEHGPYDIITVQGAIEDLPNALSEQLKIGGRIGAIRAEGVIGQFSIGTKTETGIAWRSVFDATAPVLPGFYREKSFSF